VATLNITVLRHDYAGLTFHSTKQVIFFASYDRMLGSGDGTPLILNSDTGWGKRSASRSSRFTRTLEAPGSQARTGCAGPRTSPEALEVINLFPPSGMDPRFLGFAVCSAGTTPTTLSHPPPPLHNRYQFLVFVGRRDSDGQHVC
jgi:hypothetical protein